MPSNFKSPLVPDNRNINECVRFFLCKVEEVKSGSDNIRKLIEAASNFRQKSTTDDMEVSSSETSLSSFSDSGVQYGTFSKNGGRFVSVGYIINTTGMMPYSSLRRCM